MSQAVENQPETQAQPAVAGDGSSGSKTGGKKRFRGCLLKLFLLLLLLAIGIGVSYVLSRNGSDRKFNDYIEEAVRNGQPLSIEEVVDRYYSLPAGALDTTKEWSSIIATFNSEEYAGQSRGLSWVGDDSRPRWPPVEWRDFDAAVELVNNYRRQLIELQLATAGYAILDDDFLANPELSQETIDGLTRAYDFLELSCYVAAHERDQDGLVLRLIACLSFSNCLAIHPGHLDDRLIIERRSLDMLMRAIAGVQFREEELARFRDLIEGYDYWQPIREYWDYQRAIRLIMYNDLDRFRETAFYKQLQADPKYEEFLERLDINIKYSPFSGDDAIVFLEQMQQVQKNFVGNPIQQAEVIAGLESREKSAPPGLDRYRQPTARFMVPKVSQLIEQSGDVATARNVVLALLAADKFRVKKDALPSSLSEAIDDFLNKEPMDLYIAEPIFMKRVNDLLTVMSVGPNRINNQTGQDDIGILLPREKWDALSGPLEKID